jgi:hypothetical protein
MIIPVTNLNYWRPNDESEEWQTGSVCDHGRPRPPAGRLGRAQNRPCPWHADLCLAWRESGGAETMTPVTTVKNNFKEVKEPVQETWALIKHDVFTRINPLRLA